MKMRRVYCGAEECGRGEHVWENGVRFHYEEINDYPTKEASMDPWQLPIDWSNWKFKTGTVGMSSGTTLHYTPIRQTQEAQDDQVTRRLAVLTEVMKMLEAHGTKGLSVHELVLVADWVVKRGL